MISAFNVSAFVTDRSMVVCTLLQVGGELSIIFPFTVINP